MIYYSLLYDIKRLSQIILYSYYIVAVYNIQC